VPAAVDILSAIVVIESWRSRGTSLAGPFIHCAFYGALNILENGNEAQKADLLPKLRGGEILFAYGLSEPDVGGGLASATVRLSQPGRQVRRHQRHQALGLRARESPTMSTRWSVAGRSRSATAISRLCSCRRTRAD